MLGCSCSMRSSRCSQLIWIGGAVEGAAVGVGLAGAELSLDRPAGFCGGTLGGRPVPTGLAAGGGAGLGGAPLA